MSADDKNSHSTTRNNRRIKITALMLVAVYILLLGVLVLTHDAGNRVDEVLLRGAYLLSVISAFACTLWAARHTKSYRRLWQMMAAGMLLWLMGETVYFRYVITVGVANIPTPSIADLFAVAYLPIILGVMFSLGKIRPPLDTEKKQFLVNVSMTALAMFLVLYKFVILPAWQTSPTMNVILYPMLDWIIFVSLLFASRRFLEDRIEGWVILIIAAFVSAIVGDISYFLGGGKDNAIITMSMAGLAILIALSAVDEVTGAFIGVRYRSHHKEEAASDQRVVFQSPAYTIALPFAAGMVVPIVWLAFSYKLHPHEALVLFVVATVMTVLSVYRNRLLVTDNALLLTTALRDNITELNNHRYFQEALAKAVARSKRAGKPVSLLVIDLDNFSLINSTFGHLAGDKLLKIIGRSILSTIREADEACRLGGDDFSVVMPDTDEEGAHMLAERLKQRVAGTLLDAFPDKYVTMTMGISTHPTLANSKEELVSTAEGALYWGKFNGKDTAFVYDPKVVKALSAEERAQKAEETSLLDLVKSLAEAVDARDPYTKRHSQGVSMMAGKLAGRLGLDDSAVNKIEVAGMLHDVGKIGVPDTILNKAGKLTDEEMAFIKTHTTMSAQIIQSTSLKDILPMVRGHHERWDGNGYPDGLKGEEIPFEARILAIADTFDAMTTDRPYREALTVNDALQEIERCAGTQFDPELASAFIDMCSDAAENTTEKISTSKPGAARGHAMGS